MKTILNLFVHALGRVVLDACDFIINLHNIRHRKPHDKFLVVLKQGVVFALLMYAIIKLSLTLLAFLMNTFEFLRIPIVTIVILLLLFGIYKWFESFLKDSPKSIPLKDQDFGYDMDELMSREPNEPIKVSRWSEKGKK